MGSLEGTFRTAVVGGFNRQDVLNYIEARAREHREQWARLQKAAEEERQGRETAEAEAAERRERAAALERELEDARAQAADGRGAVAQLREELERTRAALESERAGRERAEGALRELQCRAARWEQDAQAYDALKDRTATIELEAHQRARTIEREAEERAKQVRAAAGQLLDRVQAGYSRLRSDVDATIVHAGGEIGRVGRALEQVRAEFAEHDQVLEKLLTACRDTSSAGGEAPDTQGAEEAGAEPEASAQ